MVDWVISGKVAIICFSSKQLIERCTSDVIEELKTNFTSDIADQIQKKCRN